MLTLPDIQRRPSVGEDDPPIRFAVKVLNARYGFGRVDLEVQPLKGEGQAWVSAERVEING